MPQPSSPTDSATLLLRGRSVETSDHVFDLLRLPNPERTNTPDRLPHAEGNRVVENGPELEAELIRDIDAAERLICACSFLLQRGKLTDALVRAAERGVHVYLLTSTVRLDQQTAREAEDDAHTRSFKELLNEDFRHRVLLRCGPDLHAKFLLVDPTGTSSSARGWLTTGNFTDRGLCDNRELAVRLRKAETTELFHVFVRQFWEGTEDEQTATETFRKVQPVGRYGTLKLEHLQTTNHHFQETGLRDYLELLIENAQRKIVLAAYTFDPKHALFERLLQRLGDGIGVTLFARTDNRLTRQHLDRLARAGARVYLHPGLHAKFLLVDGEHGAVFTANFSAEGMDRGFEVGVPLSGANATTLHSIATHWQQTFPHVLRAGVPIAKVPEAAEQFSSGQWQPLSVVPNRKKVQEIKPTRFKDLLRGWKQRTEFDRATCVRYQYEVRATLTVLNTDELERTEATAVSGVQLGYLKPTKNKRNNERVVLVSEELWWEDLTGAELERYIGERVFGWIQPV